MCIEFDCGVDFCVSACSIEADAPKIETLRLVFQSEQEIDGMNGGNKTL